MANEFSRRCDRHSLRQDNPPAAARLVRSRRRRELADNLVCHVSGLVIDLDDSRPEKIVDILAMNETRDATTSLKCRHRGVTIETMRQPALNILELFQRKVVNAPEGLEVPPACFHDNVRFKRARQHRIQRRTIKVSHHGAH